MWEVCVCPPVHHRQVVTGCGPLRSTDVSRTARQRVRHCFSCVYCMCVFLSALWQRIDWVEQNGEKAGDFAQFSDRQFIFPRLERTMNRTRQKLCFCWWTVGARLRLSTSSYLAFNFFRVSRTNLRVNANSDYYPYAHLIWTFLDTHLCK